jgi:predicted nucleotidyltransferase
MSLQIPIDHTRLADFCRRHHVIRLAFFGSVLRSDFRPDSDVDVLYEFEPGHEPGWNVCDIEDELSAILGRKADMVPLKYINPRLRDTLLAECQTEIAV